MNGDYGNKDIEHSSANKKRHLSLLSLWQSLVIQYLHLFVMISICPKSGGKLSVWLSPPPSGVVAVKKILVLACLYCLWFKSADKLLPTLYS